MKPLFIGCDLGGTNLRAGIVDPESGQVSHLLSTPTLAREGHNAVMRRMAALIEQLISASGCPREFMGGIGIGVPGVLDLDRGLTLFLPNLTGTWPEVPLRDTISQLTDLPVVLLNDARSITYGEWRFGAGRCSETMACFAIGTGIGGGLIINAQLHLGNGGTAGELGHQTIDYNGPLCGCGNRGCLETLASGPAISAMGLKAVTQGLTTTIGELANFDLNKITPELIALAASQGDGIAQRILEEAGFYIGVAAANVCVSIGPQIVVIAGGVSRIGEPIIGAIRRTIYARAKFVTGDQVQVVQASLGDTAGVIGAALWAGNTLHN
ncbi:MAG TPA: ROK family protein [Anaerolineales bacterium]|nr:ROK family protein [Anaerolineales bacterium]